MILTVGNIKGGVGKSTLACNIVSAMATLASNTVLLIDGDKQGSAAAFTQKRSDLIGEAGFTCVRAQGMEVLHLVKTMAEKFTHIIIDAGGQDNPSLRAGLTVSDKVLVPVTPRAFEMWSLELMDTLIEEGKVSNPKLEGFVVLNNASKRGLENTRVFSALSRDYPKLKIIKRGIGQRKAFSDAVELGLGVLEHRRRNSEAIRDFFGLLIGIGLERNDIKRIYDGRTEKNKSIYK